MNSLSMNSKGEALPVNTNRPGSLAYQSFETILNYYKEAPRETLANQYRKAKAKANDYLNNSTSVMYESDFEAELIAQMFYMRFGHSIPKEAN